MLATSFILSWFKPKQKNTASAQLANAAAIQSTGDSSFVSRATNNRLVNVTMADEDADFVAIDCQPLTYAEVASLGPVTNSSTTAKSGAAAAAATALLPGKEAIAAESVSVGDGGAGTTVGVPLTSEYDLTKSGYHYRKSRLEKKKQHAFVEKKKMKKKKAKKLAMSSKEGTS